MHFESLTPGDERSLHTRLFWAIALNTLTFVKI